MNWTCSESNVVVRRLPTRYRGSVNSPRAYRPGLAVAALVIGMGLAAAPVASAEPVTITVPSADDASPAALTACPQFGGALDAAAAYYGDFADTIEGAERPDYSDPTVGLTSTVGRTALRDAAVLAMNSARTPGLAPEIAEPMRSWAVDATKLRVKMAVRTSGESLNQTAIEMNLDATTAQMACAAAGSHA